MEERIELSKRLQKVLNLIERAEKNDYYAQYMLAIFYSKIPGKEKEAFALFKKASHRVTDAMYALGSCYEEGRGIGRNYKLAVKWYKMAENNISNDLCRFPDPKGAAAEVFIREYCNNPALHSAVDYLIPEKVRPSFEEYMEMAEGGDAEAQAHIGSLLISGYDIKHNIEKGLEWVYKSIESGCTNGYGTLALYYEKSGKYKESAHWYGLSALEQIKWRNQRLGWEK